MMAEKFEITRADIIPVADYAKERAQRRKRIAEIKRNRRLAVGPFATFYFENFETMWHQVHEMLFIEKGGDGQIADELSSQYTLAYTSRNPRRDGSWRRIVVRAGRANATARTKLGYFAPGALERAGRAGQGVD